MTPEEIDKVRLLYARDYFRQGNDAKGLEFLKAVEQSDNKTKETNELLSTIRRNTKLYSNQKDGDVKRRGLSLVPSARRKAKRSDEEQ